LREFTRIHGCDGALVTLQGKGILCFAADMILFCQVLSSFSQADGVTLLD